MIFFIKSKTCIPLAVPTIYMVSGHEIRINQIACGIDIEKIQPIMEESIMKEYHSKNLSAKPQNTERPKRGGILLENGVKSL